MFGKKLFDFIKIRKYINVCLGGLANVGYHGYQKNIFEFDYETESWTKIGVMKEKLSNHALSVLSYDEYANEYAKWCN